MPRLGLVALLVHFSVVHCAAAIYYVAADGRDSSHGSSTRPFRTVMRGMQAANAGDTVIVRDGTYGHEGAVTGGDENQDNHSPVVLRKSGRPDAWITLRAERKWGAVLDCEMRCDAYIDLFNASYIVIEGFVITRGFKEGIHSNDAAHHITIRGNRIEHIANRPSSTSLGLSGMYTNQACHDFIVDGNVFHDIGRSNPSQLDHALYLHGSDITVANNVFYNIRHGWSIQTAEGLHGALIAHNVFAFENTPGKPGQIMLWGRQSNLIVRDNIFYGAEKFALARYQASISFCSIDHNMIYGATAPQVMMDASGCSLHDNRIGVDPLFVNTAREPYDFHLRADSPAIGAGAATSISIDFDGLTRGSSHPDIGAFGFHTKSNRGRADPMKSGLGIQSPHGSNTLSSLGHRHSAFHLQDQP